MSDPKPTKQRPLILRRGPAFLIDLIAIYVLGLFLHAAWMEPLLRLGPWLQLVSSAGIFCYFWLANGPLGGETLGKRLMKIHTVDAATGLPLAAGPVFRRTLLQLLPFLFPAACALALEAADVRPRIAIPLAQVALGLGLGLWLALLYSLLLRRDMRGWHDLLGGSVVTRDPTPPEIFDNPIPDNSVQPPATLLARSVGYFIHAYFILMIVIATLLPMLHTFGPEGRREALLIDALETSAPVPGYRLVAIQLPTTEGGNPEGAEAHSSLMERVSSVLAIATAETSASPPSQKPDMRDGHSVALQYDRLRDDTSPAEIDDPAIRAAIEKVRAALPEAAATLPPDANGRGTPEIRLMLTVHAADFRFGPFTPIAPFPIRHNWCSVGPMKEAAWPVAYKFFEDDALRKLKLEARRAEHK